MLELVVLLIFPSQLKPVLLESQEILGINMKKIQIFHQNDNWYSHSLEIILMMDV